MSLPGQGMVGVASPKRLAVALAMLALALAVAIGGPALERQVGERPEAAVLAYLEAVERGDGESALATLTPEQRERQRDFVLEQLGNRYRVLGVAVWAPALLNRLVGGHPFSASTVTLFLEVTQGDSGERWQTTVDVAVVRQGGRWLLERAPLRP